MRKFETVLKDKLFYNKFKYCIGFYLQEVSALRNLDHADIDVILETRRDNRAKMQQRYSSIHPMPFPISRREDITKDTGERLHTLADMIINEPDCKLVVSYNTAYVYSNTLKFIDNLGKLAFLKDKRFSKAVINRPRDTIRVVDSPYNKRSYLRSLGLTDTEAEKLKNFFKLHSKTIRLSPALTHWVETPYRRTMDYFFVDYSDTGYLTLIKLKFPNIIRKTQTIVCE